MSLFPLLCKCVWSISVLEPGIEHLRSCEECMFSLSTVLLPSAPGSHNMPIAYNSGGTITLMHTCIYMRQGWIWQRLLCRPTSFLYQSPPISFKCWSALFQNLIFTQFHMGRIVLVAKTTMHWVFFILMLICNCLKGCAPSYHPWLQIFLPCCARQSGCSTGPNFYGP